MGTRLSKLKDFFNGKIYYDEPRTWDDPDQEIYYPRAQYPTGYAKKLAFARRLMIIVALGGPLVITGTATVERAVRGFQSAHSQNLQIK